MVVHIFSSIAAQKQLHCAATTAATVKKSLICGKSKVKHVNQSWTQRRKLVPATHKEKPAQLSKELLINLMFNYLNLSTDNVKTR